MEHFDVRLHQPHPPGTFVFYILLGRLFNIFTHDENSALVWQSVILSGVGIAALYLLTRKMFGHKAGIATSILAITSPLVWFHGEVALSYMLEFTWVPLIVYACYQMKSQKFSYLLLASLLLGMAGGVRPNTPVFLFPLWLMAVIYNKYSWKQVILALVVMGIGVLLWAVPMIVESGGLQEYINIMIWWQNQHTEAAGSLLGMFEYIARFSFYLFYTLGFGIIFLVIAAFRAIPQGLEAMKNKLAFIREKNTLVSRMNCFIFDGWDWRFLVILGWLLPGTIYLTFIHLRQPGHTFTVLPGYIVLTGLAISWLLSSQRIYMSVLIGITTINAIFFLVAPTYLFNSQRMLFTTPSWNAIHEYDNYIQIRLDAVESNFSSLDTTILASGRNFRIPDYYLREYQRPDLSHAIDSGPVILQPDIHNLVILDDTEVEIDPSLAISSIYLSDGESLRYITWNADQTIVVSSGSISLLNQQ